MRVPFGSLLSFFLSQFDVHCRGVYFVSACEKANRFLSFLNSPQCRKSSWAMERAGIESGTPGNVNTPVPLEQTTEVEASETGKRKNDDTDDKETSGRGKRRRGAGGKKLRPGERYIPPPQKRNPGVSFSQEHFNETSYYFEAGLRKVYPYYFDFKTYCKGRWIGTSLLDVFKNEFRAESIEYYQKAAKEGRIRLNETPVEDLSVVLRVSLISP